LPDLQAALRAHPAIRTQGWHTVPVLDAADEQAALHQLIEGCRRSHDAFGSGPDDDDDALLASGMLTPSQRNAVTVRRGERRILRDTVGVARRALVALALPREERRRALLREALAVGAWAPYFHDLRKRLA
jgi:hypothetical protein